MRPPKVVLLAGSDEQRLSLRAFLLRTHHYSVVTAATAKEALASLTFLGRGLTGEVDLLLIDLPLMDFTRATLDEARREHPQLRALIASNHAGWYDDFGADVLLPKGWDSPAELLERIRCLVVRKRGPKKKPVNRALKPFGSKSKKPVASAQLPVVRKSKGRVA